VVYLLDGVVIVLSVGVRLQHPVRRGLRGVKLVTSDAHEGIKGRRQQGALPPGNAAGHFMRNVLAHAGKSGRRVASAFIATAFVQ
jgi:putative transposase